MDIETGLHGMCKLAGFFFATGVMGSFPYHYVKGLHASPPGSRLSGAYQAACLNAPRVGGKFVRWPLIAEATMFSMDSAGVKNYFTNSVVAVIVATGLSTAPRRGLGRSARMAAIAGGAATLMNIFVIHMDRFVAELDHEKDKP